MWNLGSIKEMKLIVSSVWTYHNVTLVMVPIIKDAEVAAGIILKWQQYIEIIDAYFRNELTKLKHEWITIF